MKAGKVFRCAVLLTALIVSFVAPVMAQTANAAAPQPTVVQQLEALFGQMLLNLVFINGPTIAVAGYVLYRVTKRAVIAGRLADVQPRRRLEED
ncbi:MAG: hypothetical protein ACREDR_22520 [Blastocatellia bacterium]